MILTVLIVLHVIISILLIVAVLIQSGKGADIGAMFGGGASQTLFGASGGKTLMVKVTVGLAIGFMVTSLLIATLPKNMSSAVTRKADEPVKPIETTLPDETPVTSTDSAPATETPASSPTAKDK